MKLTEHLASVFVWEKVYDQNRFDIVDGNVILCN